ncbi:hypothetical protein ACFYZ5_44475 [Streptomyces chartreusis]|uniref:hypothetical protein n=1 Tax=Streptomyces chartreusis TaxID=1969 RepID=UPI0036B7AE97
MSSHDGTTATHETTAVTTHDGYGRPEVVKSAITASSSTTYASSTTCEDTYLLAIKQTVTNIEGWTTSPEYTPAWDLPSAKADMKGRRIDLA